MVGLDHAVQALLDFDPDVRSSRGFSALVGAFVGMLLVAVADLLRKLKGHNGSVLSVVAVLFSTGVAAAFWNVLTYTTAPMAIALVLVPVVYAAWMLQYVETAYSFREGVQAGGWLRGRPVAVSLLWIGTVMGVWGVQSLLVFPPFEGGTNTLSHFVGIILGTLQIAILLQD